MNIVHFVKDLDPASGGPTRSVPALAEHQAKTDGVQVSILFGASADQAVPIEDSKVEYVSVKRGLPELSQLLVSNKPDLFHIHGLWSPLLHRVVRFASQQEIPYVIAPRGMMANWAMRHKALKKRAAWWLYQKKDLNSAAGVLPSSEFEQCDVLHLLPGCNTYILPNGCEFPPVVTNAKRLLPEGDSVRWAAAMGRLHPVKGYAELISAWAKANFKNWKLAIAGPDEGGYRRTLESLIESKGLGEQIVFLDQLADAEKWNLFAECELFLAPSKTENFGMVIAEALQSGTPVLTTTGTPWKELAELQCGWWVEPNVKALTTALNEAMSRSTSELKIMGARGHQLIAEKYTWEGVAANSLEIYRSIIGQGAS